MGTAMNARSLFRNLLDQVDLAAAQNASFYNWHAVGFDYLCLHRTPGLTVKLYMNRPGELRPCGNGDYLVNPHDHAYNFDTYVIHGVVTNVMFRPRGLGDYVLWDYDGATREATQRENYSWDLKEIMRLRHPAGSSYAMRADEIHTIEVRRDDPVCMLLLQYESTTKRTRLFTHESTPPSRDGLYLKPTRNETIRLVDRAMAFGGMSE